ncbi:MAG: MlaD family protein, partial [Fimbriiglobus sp.]
VPGTPVRKSGVRVGAVSTVELDEDTGLVRVNVVMDDGYRPRPSEDATISRGLLSGDTSLDFVPKPEIDGKPVPKAEPYPPDATIPGLPPINPRTLFNQASGAIPSAQESAQRIMLTFQRIEMAVPKAEKALDEIAAFARVGREAVPELRRTNAKVQELIGAADPPGGVPEPGTLKAAVKELTELLRTIRPAADDLRTLLKNAGPEITDTTKSIRRTSDSLNETLSPENRKAFAATLKSLQSGSDDLGKAIRLAAILIDGADKTIRELSARLAQAEGVLGNIDKVTKPVAANAEQIVADATAAVKSVNVAAGELSKVLVDVRQVVQKASRSDGTVSKLLTDPTLFNNLDDAAANAARLLARAEQIARDLQVFADKIARRPELIGVGGAVRPSSGLKESPTAPLPPNPLGPVAPLPPGNGYEMRPVRADGDGVLAPIPPLPREGATSGPVTIPVPAYRPPLPPGDVPADLPPR